MADCILIASMRLPGFSRQRSTIIIAAKWRAQCRFDDPRPRHTALTVSSLASGLLMIERQRALRLMMAGRNRAKLYHDRNSVDENSSIGFAFN
jgi:hypothetical protein